MAASSCGHRWGPDYGLATTDDGPVLDAEPPQWLGFPLPLSPSIRCPAGCLFLDEDAGMSQVCGSFGSFCEKNIQIWYIYVNTGSSAVFVLTTFSIMIVNFAFLF